MKYLCPASEITEHSAKEFVLSEDLRIFVVKEDRQFYGYINDCPHNSWPLNFHPNLFLNAEKTHIQCSNHMAFFEKKSGRCVSGPCVGDQLKKVPISLKKGELYTDIREK